MDRSLCSHLEEYGAQLKETRTRYADFLSAMDALRSGEPTASGVEQLNAAVSAWREEDEKLKQMLVGLVGEGRVRIPRRLLPGRRGRRSPRNDSFICSACRRRVPRLSYDEWKFASNGVVMYRGDELPLPEPAAV